MRHRVAGVEPQRFVAEALDEIERVRDEENRLVAAAEFSELVEALVCETLVADCEHLVDQQHVGVDVNRDGEAETHVHPRRIGLHRRIDEFAKLREVDNLVEARVNLALAEPEHDAVDEDVLAA